MADVHLVDHFPRVPASASIVDISTGRVFGEQSGLLDQAVSVVGFDRHRGPTYHWSQAVERNSSWSIQDPDTKILHIRAHDCPYPATPSHPTCYNCITKKLTDDIEFVFTWKAIKAEQVQAVSSPHQIPDAIPKEVDRVVRTADTPLHDLFEGLWTDVFGSVQFDLGPRQQVLLQHCGACPNPMDPRLSQCAACIRNRSPSPDFPGADIILFVKMFRPADGLERQSSFPGLADAIRGAAQPPRFGDDPMSAQTGQNQPDDTDETQVW